MCRCAVYTLESVVVQSRTNSILGIFKKFVFYSGHQDNWFCEHYGYLFRGEKIVIKIFYMYVQIITE